MNKMKLTKRKGFNFFRSYFDVYNELETDADKVAFIDALFDRQFLGIKPEGLKGMAKFAYISQTNSIDTQVKGYEDRMKALNKTDPNFDPWQGVKKTISTPPQQEEEKEKVQEKEQVQVQEKEQEEEEEKEESVIKSFSKKDFRKTLVDLGANEIHVEDWFKVRVNKKAAFTQTALNLFLNECDNNNFPVHEAVKICAENSWKGFKVEWVNNLNVKNGKQPELTNQQIAERAYNSDIAKQFRFK